MIAIGIIIILLLIVINENISKINKSTLDKNRENTTK
jgi:tetrahydromethanopterin S-methyltransferase subunit E